MSDEPIAIGTGLSCGYLGEHAVLEDVDLSIGPGEIVTILGGSGSGKSTLLKTLGGQLKPLAGKVKLFGQPFYNGDEAGQNRVRRRIGTLFQHDALLGSLTVLENVELPLSELTNLPAKLAHELARAKLELVDLAKLANRMPSQISGGQRKRVALARAMVLEPDLLLCDEPTSGLDPITSSSIDRTLLRFREVFKTAVLAVTHDVDTVRTIADRALVLGAGGVRAEGKIEELEHSGDRAIYDFFHRVELATKTKNEDRLYQTRNNRNASGAASAGPHGEER